MSYACLEVQHTMIDVAVTYTAVVLTLHPEYIWAIRVSNRAVSVAGQQAGSKKQIHLLHKQQDGHCWLQ